ncbi:MAG: hypothetical protein HND52_08130 [Ignavibacteriae bacterium]|nr:hypothetical protein [Ignavibacteriota bacterium]NOG97916.1 hypothetical protein [Ignavibacteriota bacterium]
MKIVLKITAVLAAAIGIMAIVTGSRVLFGFFDPGYPYFTSLIIYNIIMGSVSVFAGIYIWRQHSRALLYACIIGGLHILVLLSLLTIFNDVISNHSIGSMTFRSAAWIIFSLVVWKGYSRIEKANSVQQKNDL